MDDEKENTGIKNNVGTVSRQSEPNQIVLENKRKETYRQLIEHNPPRPSCQFIRRSYQQKLNVVEKPNLK